MWSRFTEIACVRPVWDGLKAVLREDMDYFEHAKNSYNPMPRAYQVNEITELNSDCYYNSCENSYCSEGFRSLVEFDESDVTPKSYEQYKMENSMDITQDPSRALDTQFSVVPLNYQRDDTTIASDEEYTDIQDDSSINFDADADSKAQQFLAGLKEHGQFRLKPNYHQDERQQQFVMQYP
ncbi:unnamed protein product [Bursaphelenchus okinawaensis]|uniref:Uncharacterized protein n=1 Tax=Bursaphelenchus okinawaensis TaxID=465554 RepID=A0A811LI13_9BILA|nr:unnamed protein product [Bursaphelenchus okinawaensis]CAG9124176.1 unnamed protein product [Bursaphelenchus okinawaensis]